MTDQPMLYGIPNCDTVRKARRWLETRAIDYRFHDLRADGIDEATVRRWLDAVGAETLVNRRSTTWKQLTEPDRHQATGPGAAALLVRHPTLIKRPVLADGAGITVGFNEATYAERFGASPAAS